MTTLLDKTIRLFAESIGREEEYSFYLKKFQTDEHPCFAVLCPERNGFEDVSSFFAFDIQFLLQLELTPMILICGAEAEAMQTMLMADGESFRVRQIDSPEFDREDLSAFLNTCRSAKQCAILVAPRSTRTELLVQLVPDVSKRVHFIRSRGPLRTLDHEPLFQFYTSRHKPEDLEEADRSQLNDAVDFLFQRPGAHVSIASPWDLLQELFTVKGAGTIVRRGSVIRRVDHPDDIDRERLLRMLEEGFGRRLVLDAVFKSMAVIYLEENYRGAAVLDKACGYKYLSKFGVGTEARGEGLAVELWREMSADHPSLFWRSRRNNPFQHWYEKQADGYHRSEDWVVYWRGIPPADLSAIIQYAQSRPDDFVSSEDST